MTENIVLIAYGLFLILGGFFGYQKGSKISLVMGVVSGMLVFLGLWVLTFNPKGAWVYLSVVNSALSVVFILRLIKTRSFMPSGMLLIITLAVLIFCLNQLR